MGDPKTGAIYQLNPGEQPKEGDVKLTQGEAEYLQMLTDPEDRKKVLQGIARKLNERALTISDRIMNIVEELSNHPTVEVDPRAWQHLLIFVPQEELERRLAKIKESESA